jgi:hypothetical protein
VIVLLFIMEKSYVKINYSRTTKFSVIVQLKSGSGAGLACK